MINPADISTVLVAAGALIAAMGTAVATIITALRTNQRQTQTNEKVDAAAELSKQNGLKADAAAASLNQIHGLVNGSNTQKDAKIEALQREVESLKAQLAQEAARADLLAKAAALALRSREAVDGRRATETAIP